ncbi:hypothetical protein G3N95_14770 [Paraburkholderia sp. Tr-20389]|uniref:DUF5677 domain-containing protein n=1 Tax=Paraburkholderia sp. Tr-20389 TaxID=2703903 RepID=UPI00197E7265|nr:DUF5677 domain-containing protein [Paraburkholderia sp. Tr-20389]MBN3754212.1 hypothetical protein [Paraburkholderia sp. Tr-20389]
MTFETEDFAGRSAAALQAEQRQRNGELFDFADKCARLALEIAGRLRAVKNRRQLVAGAFFARCVTHFQAAMLLAESGMTLESLAMSRGLLETVFVMLAIAEDAVSPGELAAHDSASRVKHANTLLNAKDYGNVEPFKEKLQDFSSLHKDSATIDMREFARRGKALAAYDGLYRHLSHHAAHPSLSAVDEYFERHDGGKFSVQLKPLFSKTPAAVLSAATGILLACFACEKCGLSIADTDVKLGQTWSECEKLDQRYRPWA